jgi:hypothetical protein
MTTDPTSPLGTAAKQRGAAAESLEFSYGKDPRIDKHLYAAQAYAHAQIAIALELADIAASLRVLARRPREGHESE